VARRSPGGTPLTASAAAEALVESRGSTFAPANPAAVSCIFVIVLRFNCKMISKQRSVAPKAPEGDGSDRILATPRVLPPECSSPRRNLVTGSS
jgi:hypothetical protein